MATVHPSRMGLVPQDPKDTYLARRHARSRDRERDRSRERRRASPEYTDYKRPTTPPPAEAPWRSQENLYPNRQGRDRPPHAGGSYGGGGSEYLERYVCSVELLDNSLTITQSSSTKRWFNTKYLASFSQSCNKNAVCFYFTV